jgi:hypothetical protein
MRQQTSLQMVSVCRVHTAMLAKFIENCANPL